jgi:iron complex transport system ATP-binding protein
MMGRYPHLGAGRPPGNDDDLRVDAAMRQADVAHLATRPFPRLSGGEQARVALARVLAQDAPVVLLDEPSAAFDLHHQMRLVAIVRGLAAAGHAVVIVVHDLNTASACADRIALLRRGRLLTCAPPRDALVPELLDALYEQPVVVVRHPTSGRPVVIPDDVEPEDGCVPVPDVPNPADLAITRQETTT